MFILAIETTGPVGSVAVLPVPESGKPLPEKVPMKITTYAMSHLKNLMKMTEDLLGEQKIGKEEIAAVAVSVGPGSFTGIRIGVSTGRALSQALGIPCVSVPTLEVFREKAEKTPVCVIFNARRGQVYAACFDEGCRTVIEPGPYMLKDVLDRIEELGISPLFYGDGIDAYWDQEEFKGRLSGFRAADKEERYQTSEMVGKYAVKKYAEGDTIEYGNLMPDYMRESEAEQRLKDGSLERMRKAKLERLMNA